MVDACRHCRQAAIFSGHHWAHGLKYQGITAPNGLTCGCFGPSDGRDSDVKVLTDSGIISLFPQLAIHGRLFRLYGDGIYPMMLHLLRPFLGALPGSVEALFNEIMSQIRVSVEWSFGTLLYCAHFFSLWTCGCGPKSSNMSLMVMLTVLGLITNTFQAVDFTRWQRSFLTYPALQYRVATLLTNVISCIRGTNMIARYFQSPLPTLAQYLHGHF